MGELTQEQKDLIAAVNLEATKAVDEAMKGTKADFDLKLKAIEDSVNKNNANGDLDKVLEDIAEIKSNMAELFKRKGAGIDMNTKSGLEDIVSQVLDNESYKDFSEGRGGKKTGKMSFETKGIVSLSQSYTGNILISEQSPVVVSHPQTRKINLRDIITNTSGDAAYPSLTFTQITDLDRNVEMVSENGRLPEAAFKAKEVTYTTKRIGTHIPISRRMLKSRTYMQSWMLANIPKWIRQSEDFQILKGDGTGENLQGISKICPDFKDVLGSLITGAAGSILSVSSYDGGAKTIIEFTNPQPLINNGMKITFAAFDNAPYNASFIANKINDRQVMVEVAYVSQTAPQAALATFTAGGEFAGTVENANEVDAIAAAQKYLTYSIYNPNAAALNPIDVFRIQSLKNTLGDQLRMNVTVVNGITYVGGLPIVETTAVPVGEVYIGDFANAAELVDYTSLELEFAEDVETKLTNQVVLIAQAEVIFPIYNPYAFLKFKFADVLPILEKP